MSQEGLNCAQASTLLEQMRGEAMTKGMRPHLLLDTRIFASLSAYRYNSRDRKMTRPSVPDKQPCGGPILVPIRTQTRQQLFREHDVAVLVALALFNTDTHTGAINVTDSESSDF